MTAGLSFELFSLHPVEVSGNGRKNINQISLNSKVLKVAREVLSKYSLQIFVASPGKTF